MSIDTSRLSVEVTEEENWKRSLQVTVPADVVERERQDVARTFSSRVNLPGFRKGKVPASVVEKRFGPALRQETLDRVIQEAYREALRQREIHPIADGEVQDIQYEAQEDLSFRVVVEVAPQVEVERVGGFAVKRPPVEVTEEDESKVLNRLRTQHGVRKPVEEGPPDFGDQVRVQILPLTDEEDEDTDEDGEPREYEITLGEGEAIPDVEEAIRTLSVGETNDFTVRFPEDFPNEERRGEEERLRITLESRKVLELPELDDEFASTVGDFETVEELKERVRQDLVEEMERNAESRVRAQLVDHLLEANPFEVPEAMVEQYLQSYLGDTGNAPAEEVERAKESLRPQAERAVKRALIVDRVAEMQGLQATEDEVDERVQRLAEENEVEAGEVYSRLQQSGRLQGLEREIQEEKVFSFLKEQSTIEEGEPS